MMYNEAVIYLNMFTERLESLKEGELTPQERAEIIASFPATSDVLPILSFHVEDEEVEDTDTDDTDDTDDDDDDDDYDDYDSGDFIDAVDNFINTATEVINDKNIVGQENSFINELNSIIYVLCEKCASVFAVSDMYKEAIEICEKQLLICDKLPQNYANVINKDSVQSQLDDYHNKSLELKKNDKEALVKAKELMKKTRANIQQNTNNSSTLESMKIRAALKRTNENQGGENPKKIKTEDDSNRIINNNSNPPKNQSAIFSSLPNKTQPTFSNSQSQLDSITEHKNCIVGLGKSLIYHCKASIRESRKLSTTANQGVKEELATYLESLRDLLDTTQKEIRKTNNNENNKFQPGRPK